MGQIEISMH